MRITFLTPHINISGGVKMILGYANRLAKREHKVNVICPMPTLARRKIKGVPIVYPKRAIMNFLKYKPDWIECIANIRYVPSYDEKYIPDADVIVATAWQTAPYVNGYSVKKGKKFYFIQNYESFYYGAKDEVDKTYTFPMRKIVVSNWLKFLMEKEFNSRSILIVNPIDFNVFYSTRNSYNKNKRICMLHHTYNWKGISDGINAFKKAKRAYPNIKLIMFGAKCEKVNISCEYHYKPTGDKLRDIYNSCDIFLCPSWREGFGLPSAEAMACKCALVTTDNGGCRDYAIDGKTALVSPPKNPEALAENLKKLLGSSELLKKIAENGYEHIKQFTWQKAVDKLEKVFKESLTVE